jgi:deoxyhypusine synthase
MLISLAGAMSTAELGKILAEMIRQGQVDIISCTGANLEEDVMNLVAHDHYERVPNYRDLTPQQERALLDRGMNRVTDTCIPEHEAFRRLEKHAVDLWKKDQSGNRRFPHQYFYEMINSGVLKQYYQIDPKDSWMVAAAERNLPIICPGWEDSTLGNIFAGHCMVGDCEPRIMKSGIEYMMFLADWYTNNAGTEGIGFFQIGGGIAGDFPICVVPMLQQDLERETPFWSYFCQISDSTTSYRFLQRCRAQREDHLGKARHRHPEVHHRKRCYYCRTAHLRLHPGHVSLPPMQRLIRSFNTLTDDLRDSCRNSIRTASTTATSARSAPPRARACA